MNNIYNKKMSKPAKVTIIIMAIFTIIFSIVALSSYTYQKKIRKEMVVTAATIIDLDDNNNGVLIEYTADGVVYTGRLNYYHSGMKAGNSLDVYYNPKIPNKVYYDTPILTVIMTAFALVGLVITLIIVYINYINKKKINQLFKEGIPITAKIISIEKNTLYRVNGKNPYIIKVEAIHPFTGILTIFKSDNVYYDPNEVIEKYNIEHLTVFLDSSKNKSYYVNIESLDKYKNN